MDYLPYLSESVVGGGFELGSFLYLLMFLAVIGVWIISALPMIGGLVGWKGKSKPENPALIREATLENPGGVPFLVVPTAQTPTPEPSPTPTPEPSPTPEYIPQGGSQNKEIGFATFNPDLSYSFFDANIRLSYYWPPLGGINCDQVNGVDECETTAMGESWKPYIGWGAACPAEFPIGSIIQLGDLYFYCMDRGGAIKKENGYYWIDILYSKMPFNNWGDVVAGRVFIPDIENAQVR